MYSAPCLTGVFSICFFLFVTIWVTSLGSILRSCELRRNFSFTPCFRGPQMVRYASAFRLLPAQVHSSGTTARNLALLTSSDRSCSILNSSGRDPATSLSGSTTPWLNGCIATSLSPPTLYFTCHISSVVGDLP